MKITMRNEHTNDVYVFWEGFGVVISAIQETYIAKICKRNSNCNAVMINNLLTHLRYNYGHLM